MATCVAAAAIVAVLAADPAHAAGPAAPLSHPRHLARPAHGLLATPDIPSTGTFQIVNGENHGCIGIAGAPPDGYAGDWNCTTNPDQTWHLGSKNADGFFQLVNGRGQCLGVVGGSDNQGARIVGFTCLGTGHPDQYWGSVQRPDGLDVLVNDHGYNDPNAQAWIIGVSGASFANGAPLVLWPDNGHPDQEWS